MAGDTVSVLPRSFPRGRFRRTAGRDGHAGLRPQRGRLRGARRPARRRRLRPGRRRRDADAVVVNTCGFVERPRRTPSTRCWPRPTPGRKVVAVGCLAERYGAELAGALPEADAVLGFDDYAAIWRPAGRRPGRRPLVPHTPRDRRDAAADHARCQRAGAAEPPCPGTDAPAESPGAPATSAAPQAAGGRARRPAEARLRLRPALRLLRHPVVPRGVRLPRRRPRSSARRAGWPSRASASWCWSARTPPPTARTCGDLRSLEKLLPALAAVRGHRPGCGVLPAAGRDPARADRGHRRHPRCAPLLRHVLPARLRAGAAPDAPVRRHRALPALIEQIRRSRPSAGSAPTSSSASPARPRTTSPSWSASWPRRRLDAVGVFGYSDEDGTEASACPASSTRT